MSTSLLIVVGLFSGCSSFLSSRSIGPKGGHRPAATLLDHTEIDGRLAGCVAEIFLDSPSEVITPALLHAEGHEIPSWLRGTLLRNGPGIFSEQDQTDSEGGSGGNNPTLRKYDHVFDGCAKITRYNFGADNSVHFSTRFIDSSLYKAMKKASMPAAAYAGPVSPPFTSTEKLLGMVGSNFDNAPVNVHQVGGPEGPLVAMTDFSLMMEFDPETLETVGQVKSPSSIVSFGGIETFSTAHPHFSNGYSYNLFTELRPVPLPFCSKSNIVHLVRSDSNLKRETIGRFETGGADIVPYIHDFSLTEKYAVVCVWPARWNMEKSFDSKGMMKNMMWVGDTVNTKVYVFDINNGEGDGKPVAVFEAPPMFAYHHINAYEDTDSAGDTSIVVDFSGYESLDIANGDHGFALLHNVKDPNLRKLQCRDAQQYRFRLPMTASGSNPSTGTDPVPVYVKPSVLVARDRSGRELTFELPRIDPRTRSKKHRFSYGFTGFLEEGKEYDVWGLVKLDHHAAELISQGKSSEKNVTALTWSSPYCFPSEAIFVPNPTDPLQEEDSGVLLSQVYDGVRQETFLLVLNPRDMKEMGRYYTGIRCPISFHGQYFQST